LDIAGFPRLVIEVANAAGVDLMAIKMTEPRGLQSEFL
jgi:hypothetical protein